MDRIRRSWGYYEVIEDRPEENYKIKRLVFQVNKPPMSTQKHELRDEHWICVRGSLILELHNGKELQTILLSSRDDMIHQAYIPKGWIHTAWNWTSNIESEIIEVQTGTCKEDDIIRFDRKQLWKE